MPKSDAFLDLEHLREKTKKEYMESGLNSALHAICEELAPFSISHINYLGLNTKSHKNLYIGTSAQGQDILMEKLYPDVSYMFSRILAPHSGALQSPYSIHPFHISQEDLPITRHKSVLRMHTYSEDFISYYFLFFADTENAFTHNDLAERLFDFATGPFKEILSNSLVLTFADEKKEKANELLQKCPDMQNVWSQIELVSQTDATVLIYGETGTGKEIIADSIQGISPRANAPYVKINCGALPETLLSSLFFGYEKGAFTGASTRCMGYFEQAQGGTILLDEIGELSLTGQAYLLRVLDNREIQRVGGLHRIPLNIRILASTNRDLAEMVREKKFRADLWFRLNEYEIFVPPLRNRPDDIEPLTQYFLKKSAQSLDLQQPPMLRKHDLHVLRKYPWPGNIRELEHVVKKAVLHCHRKNFAFTVSFHCGEGITLEQEKPHFPSGSFSLFELFSFYSAHNPPPSMDTLKKEYIRWCVEKCDQKIYGPGSASELLQVHPHTIRNLMRDSSVVEK